LLRGLCHAHILPRLIAGIFHRDARGEAGNSEAENIMNVKRPWLRFFNADDSGAGGASGGGTDGGAAGGTGTGGTDDNGAGGTGGTDGGGAGGADTGGDDGKGGKAAVLADLAKERDARQALDTENQTLKAQLQELQDKGLTPEQKAERDAQQTAGRVGDLEPSSPRTPT
jgi:hypothetical protein